MLTFKKFLLEYATHHPSVKYLKKGDNSNNLALLINNNDFNVIKKEEFKKYLLEDCLQSLKSVEYLNNTDINQLISLLEQLLIDPQSLKEKESLFLSIADTAHENIIDYSSYVEKFIAKVGRNIWNIIYEPFPMKYIIDFASYIAPYAAKIINPNVSEHKLKNEKLQEYVRVAKILLSQHTNDKHDRKDEIIDAINTNNDHKLRVLLNDYIQENEPQNNLEFTPENSIFSRFKKYIEELHGLENISVEHFMDLLIKNKPELLLFVRKYM